MRFADGSEAEFDAIVLGTGYALDLDFLSPDLRETLGANEVATNTYRNTFHPDAPGLALVGLMHTVGPFFPMVEQQARWIAYAWSDACPMAPDADMRAAIAAAGGPPSGAPLAMHVMAVAFAREAGIEPEVTRWPDLARALLFGPLSAVSFRLSGRDALRDAVERTAHAARAFDCVPTPQFTEEQSAQVRALAAARKDAALGALAATTPPSAHPPAAAAT